MRTIAVAMVRNEADIIEAFVRHHLALVEHLVVIDHRSTDATPAILQALVEEGLALSVLRDGAIAFRQADRLTAVLHDALESHDADYAFALDADEFVLAGSRADLHERLAAGGARAGYLLPWRLYVGPARQGGETHPLRRLVMHAVPPAGTPTLHKVVVGRAFVGQPWGLAEGNHGIVVDTGRGERELALEPLPGIALAHLPFRSPGQFLGKIVLGWLSHRLRTGPEARTSPINWHWRELFGQWLDGMEPDWPELERLALQWYLLQPVPGMRPVDPDTVRFDHAPIPCPFELRHTPPGADAPLARVIAWTDALLSRVQG